MKNDYSYRVISIDVRSPVADLLNRPLTDGLPVPLFELLRDRYGDYVKYETSIELERPWGHPELTELLHFAREIGAIIPTDRSQTPSQVSIRDYKIYSTEEKENALLVECERRKPAFAGISTVKDEESLGLRFFLKSGLKLMKQRCAGSVGNLHHVLAVRGSAKDHLEKANLKHLKLVPLLTDAPDGRWPDGVEPLCLVWSDYELPPVPMPLFDNFGNVYPKAERLPKVRGGYYLLDGYEINPALKYDNLDVETFDVARTFERFGGEQPCYHRLVYSQVARKVLEEIGGEWYLRPVRLGSSESGQSGSA